MARLVYVVGAQILGPLADVRARHQANRDRRRLDGASIPLGN
jgi:hypothetical protein